MFMLEDRIQLTKTGNRVAKPTLGLATQGHKLLTLAAHRVLHLLVSHIGHERWA